MPSPGQPLRGAVAPRTARPFERPRVGICHCMHVLRTPSNELQCGACLSCHVLFRSRRSYQPLAAFLYVMQTTFTIACTNASDLMQSHCWPTPSVSRPPPSSRCARSGQHRQRRRRRHPEGCGTGGDFCSPCDVLGGCIIVVKMTMLSGPWGHPLLRPRLRHKAWIGVCTTVVAGTLRTILHARLGLSLVARRREGDCRAADGVSASIRASAAHRAASGCCVYASTSTATTATHCSHPSVLAGLASCQVCASCAPLDVRTVCQTRLQVATG